MNVFTSQNFASFCKKYCIFKQDDGWTEGFTWLVNVILYKLPFEPWDDLLLREFCSLLQGENIIESNKTREGCFSKSIQLTVISLKYLLQICQIIFQNLDLNRMKDGKLDGGRDSTISFWVFLLSLQKSISWGRR